MGLRDRIRPRRSGRSGGKDSKNMSGKGAGSGEKPKTPGRLDRAGLRQRGILVDEESLVYHIETCESKVAKLEEKIRVGENGKHAMLQELVALRNSPVLDRAKNDELTRKIRSSKQALDEYETMLKEADQMCSLLKKKMGQANIIELATGVFEAMNLKPEEKPEGGAFGAGAARPSPLPEQSVEQVVAARLDSLRSEGDELDAKISELEEKIAALLTVIRDIVALPAAGLYTEKRNRASRRVNLTKSELGDAKERQARIKEFIGLLVRKMDEVRWVEGRRSEEGVPEEPDFEGTKVLVKNLGDWIELSIDAFPGDSAGNSL